MSSSSNSVSFHAGLRIRVTWDRFIGRSEPHQSHRELLLLISPLTSGHDFVTGMLTKSKGKTLHEPKSTIHVPSLLYRKAWQEIDASTRCWNWSQDGNWATNNRYAMEIDTERIKWNRHEFRQRGLDEARRRFWRGGRELVTPLVRLVYRSYLHATHNNRRLGTSIWIWPFELICFRIACTMKVKCRFNYPAQE